MGIKFDDKNKVFHLSSKEMSYIIKIDDIGNLVHLYWGNKIEVYNYDHLLQSTLRDYMVYPYKEHKESSLDTLPQEYPAYGTSDFRTPAYQIQLNDGTTISDLKYKSHRIFKGKNQLKELPATYTIGENDAETLEIEAYDEMLKLQVNLYYTVYEELNVLTRSSKFLNLSNENIKILRALSCSVDFKDDKFDLMHLTGAWARERHIERIPIGTNSAVIESKRGASSHQQNPFIALLRKDADEQHGEVYGFNFVYSGNFTAQAEVDQFKTCRVSMGINPFDFSWLLQSKEQFQTPEVVMVYSNEGIGKMSRTYHTLYRTRLCRGAFREKERPILVNNWEATYFKFDDKKLLDIAREGKKLGIELFVLDDGWFAKRDNDRCSLGDWYENKSKLTKGIKGLAEDINDLGLKFGLWIEPEMVSPDSELYRLHPNWCLHVNNRRRSESRNQLILDFSREDVCNYIIDTLTSILSSSNIGYIKWDMNRNMTEVGSELLPPERQRETAHRYILGLYKVMNTLVTKFPNILFEGCAGGGGRFDPGILYYMPQIWTSDNTDAIARLKIQYGTSIVYPPIMMTSHVSAVPNHQVGRITPLKTRGDVAMAGNLGYELDLTKLDDEEKNKIKKQIQDYKEIRRLVQFGDLYRLISPFKENKASWMIVSKDKKEFIVYFYRMLMEPNAEFERLKLSGINPSKKYKLHGSEEIYFGSELMFLGLPITCRHKDFQSIVLRFKAIN
ncbi:alpha-galactosidase [Clostridium novyi A str. 4552]|uniref:Alpha-galactosidase n=1 Tax=Clostridium novyi A str. 4552 TaxID=1444289 RepID=A0A0A0I939_CLONO|nr:alpha-galactosidase [Clostridium novyi]KGM97999.1 alpha-galactosidase [Clostridium novyi A str. 4552]